ncbi:unnamed protein product [Dicrocoelium dendriticum]|nr:unnamed protein product [Dicrocoelium dendriticum]
MCYFTGHTRLLAPLSVMFTPFVLSLFQSLIPTFFSLGQLTPAKALTTRFIWTSTSVGHGALRFVAPQTRLRVVDNSPWSSIAPRVADPRKRTPQTVGHKTIPTSGLDLGTVLNSGSRTLAMKPALCIRVCNSTNRGRIGDKVVVAVGGVKKRGWIVGTRQPSRDGWPRFESNNIVLVDDDGNPLGTRILVPIPSRLRSLPGDISKILSIATTLV